LLVLLVNLSLKHMLIFAHTHTDKTIKLWKIYEKRVQSLVSFGSRAGPTPPRSTKDLVLPLNESKDTVVSTTARRVFSNAHAYHINSISLNSDGETYISSDDLRVNLWNLSINDQSFNIVDIKPTNMEELTEVITCAEFHPQHCNIFTYSSSKGTIKLADMRAAALCDRHSKLFEESDEGSNKSFFSEIISSISDIKFSSDGKYIISRDYMTLKIWDLAMERKPVKTINIHDHLRSKLCDLYENDCIFDKFECATNHDGK
jgi:serine/threonine-protein phosphatase 2A regulatory subunit B